MGNLFRQYWIPVVPTSHLNEPGGRPLRVRLLGEDLVLFRTTAGAVGLIGAFCPHRLAPLYFGRVEARRVALRLSRLEVCAERQVYRDAQYPAGATIHGGSATPRLSLSSNAAASSGPIWGLQKLHPNSPTLNFLRVPDGHRIYRLFYQEANYLQVLEGGIDPTHVMWLHSPYDLSDEEMNQQQPAQQRAANKLGVKKTPGRC